MKLFAGSTLALRGWGKSFNARIGALCKRSSGGYQYRYR